METNGKIDPFGKSAGVLLSRDVLLESGLKTGDEVVITASPGKIEIRTSNADFVRQLTLARDIMAKKRNALGELAKR